MFAQFLNIVFSSIKLEKSLYSDNKFFGEAGIYFAGLIMILDGVAGAVAANSFVKTSIGVSGLTAVFTWLIWAVFIYVGVKLFSDESKVTLKVLTLDKCSGPIPATPDFVPIIFLHSFDFVLFTNETNFKFKI